MIKEVFGNRVKSLRDEKLMSQDELAALSNIDRTQISKIEKGKINVTLETIKKIADAFKISIKELMNIELSVPAHPFVKWAGGKTQILNKLKEYMPVQFKNYYEPFVGGGALLFSISPKKAVINDFNSELICAYKCFTDESLYGQLMEKLKEHENNHSEEYYYQIREMDRNENFLSLPIFERAARMIYLNKTCFNGLYRVNSKGYFNVPSAKKNTVNTFDKNNFKMLKKYFMNSNIKILNVDFEQAVKNAKEGDFVYFDPPYDIYPDKYGFVDYGKDGFGKEEQIRLANCFKRLSDKGVYVMLSNHNTKFINKLYNGFNIHVIEAKRMINSKADGRGNVEEVIVTNY